MKVLSKEKTVRLQGAEGVGFTKIHKKACRLAPPSAKGRLGRVRNREWGQRIAHVQPLEFQLSLGARPVAAHPNVELVWSPDVGGFCPLPDAHDLSDIRFLREKSNVFVWSPMPVRSVVTVVGDARGGSPLGDCTLPVIDTTVGPVSVTPSSKT